MKLLLRTFLLLCVLAACTQNALAQTNEDGTTTTPSSGTIDPGTTDPGTTDPGTMNHGQSVQSPNDSAASSHDHAAMMQQADLAGLPVGVEEKLGEYLADGTVFFDSQGNPVDLKEAVDIPTIILPVYYTCPSVCNLMLSSFASILGEVKLEPGKDIRLIAVSFDEFDTPEMAAQKKHQYLNAIQAPYPPEDWLFLSGDRQTIVRAMNAMGYGFKRVDNLFAHPSVVLAVAPDGKIVRYLYGTNFLPFDIEMAASEAARGRTGVSVKRLLAYCFNYDPEGKRYVFDFMRVAGYSIGGFAFLLLMGLLIAGKKKKQ